MKQIIRMFINMRNFIGFFYMILAGVAMLVISKKDHNKKALIGVHICLILISFTLVVANACQIGLIHQYATTYSAEVGAKIS